MRIILIASVFLATACLQAAEDPSIEWNAVLAQKRHMKRASEDRALAARQRYVDALRRFVARHPDHARAREVYRSEQIDYATALMKEGRYDEAMVIAENVIDRDGADSRATRIRADAISRRSVPQEKLATLKAGMSGPEVERILGTPRPGWKKQLRRHGASLEAWYYPREDGGTVGVFFRNGRLLTADKGNV